MKTAYVKQPEQLAEADVEPGRLGPEGGRCSRTRRLLETSRQGPTHPNIAYLRAKVAKGI